MGRYLSVRKYDSEYGLSFETLGLEKDLSTPSSSNRLSSVAARNSSRILRLGNAVIGVQKQRLLTALAVGGAFCAAVPLTQAGSALEIRCNGWIVSLSNVPGHHFAAPNVDHEVEIQPDSSNGGGQVGDVPTPHLIRTCCTQPRYWTRLLWWPCSTAPVDLSVGMKHPIKAALRTDNDPLVGKGWHNLPWWQ